MKSKLVRTVLAAAALSLSTAVSADVLVTTNAAGVPDNAENRAIGACVRAIYEYWPKRAGLMLPHTGRMQTEDGVRLISISGSVWQEGVRQRMSHQCRSRHGVAQSLSVAPAPGDERQSVAALFR